MKDVDFPKVYLKILGAYSSGSPSIELKVDQNLTQSMLTEQELKYSRLFWNQITMLHTKTKSLSPGNQLNFSEVINSD